MNLADGHLVVMSFLQKKEKNCVECMLRALLALPAPFVVPRRTAKAGAPVPTGLLWQEPPFLHAAPNDRLQAWPVRTGVPAPTGRS